MSPRPSRAIRNSVGEGQSSTGSPLPVAVIVVTDSGTTPGRNIGIFSYRVLPRLGEMLQIEDDEQQAQMYCVAAVHHPRKPTDVAADLWVVHVGTTSEEIGRMVTARRRERAARGAEMSTSQTRTAACASCVPVQRHEDNALGARDDMWCATC